MVRAGTSNEGALSVGNQEVLIERLAGDGSYSHQCDIDGTESQLDLSCPMRSTGTVALNCKPVTDVRYLASNEVMRPKL